MGWVALLSCPAETDEGQQASASVGMQLSVRRALAFVADDYTVLPPATELQVRRYAHRNGRIL